MEFAEVEFIRGGGEIRAVNRPVGSSNNGTVRTERRPDHEKEKQSGTQTIPARGKGRFHSILAELIQQCHRNTRAPILHLSKSTASARGEWGDKRNQCRRKGWEL